jgi:glycosyltransferase involved in cell wall biosynthesis
MRVCLVSREVAPFINAGGIATYTPLMARSLVAAGHEAHILTCPHEGMRERIPANMRGVVWHTAEVTDAEYGLDGWFSDLLKHSMAVYRALKRLHAEHRFDWIEFPDYNGEAYWSVRAKRTLGEFGDTTLAVRTHMPDFICCDFDQAPRINREKAIIWHMERRSLAEADVLTSPSRAMLEKVIEYLGDEAPHDADQPRFVIANPLDVDKALHDMGGHTIDPPVGPGRQTVLCVGRTQMVKGVTLLVDAGRRLLAQGLDLNFHFIGGDTYTSPLGQFMRPHLEKMVPACFKDRFIFEGFRPREGLGRAIRSATVCCYPSLFESFSMACVEGMSLGAAVVGSNSGGIGEIIQHGVNGWHFEQGSVASLEAALARLLSDGALRERLSAAAPARVRELCDPAGIVRQVAEVADYCVGRIAHRPGATVTTEPPETRHIRDNPPPRKPAPPIHVRSEPRFVVMVPFYNAAGFFPETLESIRSQTRPADEILIVDDGSTEPASVQMLDHLRQQPGIRVVRKPNGGPSSARNYGLRATDADWVVSVDSDDIITPQYIEKAAACALKNPDAGVVASVMTIYDFGMSTPKYVWTPLGFDLDLLLYMNVGAPGTSVLNRVATLEVGGYDENMPGCEDWELWARMGAAGYRACIMPEFLLRYRSRPEGLNRSLVGPNEEVLKAKIIRRHAAAAPNPDLALRVQWSDTAHARHRIEYLEWQLSEARREAESLKAQLGAGGLVPSGPSVHVDERAIELLHENYRYRLADSVNNALKSVGVQRAMKRVVRGIIPGQNGTPPGAGQG